MTKARMLATLMVFSGACVHTALANSPDFEGVTRGNGDTPSMVDLPEIGATSALEGMGADYDAQEAVAALVELEEQLENGGLISREVQDKLSAHGEEWLETYQAELQGDAMDVDAFFELAMSEQQSEDPSPARSYEAVARKIQAVELALSRFMQASMLARNSSGFRTIGPARSQRGLDPEQASYAEAYLAKVRADLLKQSREIRAVLQQG